jgi:putative DNA primase/helicase
MTSVAEIALQYARRGWNPIPIPFRAKKPIIDGWQRLVIPEVDIPDAFAGKTNIGIVLGPVSDGLTDVDLDCAEAIALAPHFLQKTSAIFGRQSKRSSHWLYQTGLGQTSDKAVITFKDPTRPNDQLMLLEVRVGGAKGAQTVFPGSVHEGGEPIEWVENGRPTEADSDDLLRRANALAAACLFARYWPGQGGRHDASLVLGGFFARCGYAPAAIRYFVEAISRAAGDPEWKDRRQAGEDAAKAYNRGDPAAGFPRMNEMFGKVVAERAAEWLGYSGSTDDIGGAKAERGHPAEKSTNLSNDLVTEDNAAHEFADLHADNLRFCHDQNVWFRFNGCIWAPDRTNTALQLARELARNLADKQDGKKRYITSKTAFADAILKFAKVDRRLAVSADYWNSDPFLLGAPGGTVDLRTGELRPSSLDDGITKSVLVAPLDEPCPVWDRFLRETTGNDADLILFLQQWCGYVLTGSTREHALVFVYGPGGNGKSVFLNIVTSILRDYAKTAAMDAFIASKYEKHPTDLAMLRGARLVTASETEEGRAWAEARIKQMTGGDPITARFMRQDNFTFNPQFKLMIVGNHKPVLHNVDDAARRRFNIVPFLMKPQEPDRELEAKLLREAPGIVQWMIRGCLRWQQTNLVRPLSVQAATESYFSDQDLAGQWLEDCCDVRSGQFKADRTPAIWDTTANLFESWTEYAVKAGETAGTKRAFGDSLVRRGFARHREPGTGNRGFGFVRVKVPGAASTSSTYSNDPG